MGFLLDRTLFPARAVLIGLALGMTIQGALLAGEAGVSLRVVDETAPPGGLALVFIELTEPKPLSGGRVRFAYGGGPLGGVVAVALLDGVGQVQATLLSTDQGAVVQFTSAMATFGTAPDLPLMAVAIAVRPGAQPGQTVPLAIDLGDSVFLDPQGQPYPGEVKPGTFTVGGVSVTGMTPSDGPAAAGSTIRFSGVGFQPGFDLNVEGASLASTRLNSSGEIEAVLGAAFTILPTTRVRLRNPDDSEDFFYPAVVSRPTGQNRPPVARDDSASTPEDTAVEIAVLANDDDSDGDPLSVMAAGPAQNGSTQILSGLARYTPHPDFYGSDRFSYTVSDGRGGSAVGMVMVTVGPVNDPPAVAEDTAETAPDQPVFIPVLDNDTDIDGDALSLEGVARPNAGLAVAAGDGEVVYFPPPGFLGVDRFEYQVADGQGGVSTGSVQVRVRLTDLPPLAGDDAAATIRDGRVEISVLENDADPNNGAIRVQSVAAPREGTAEVRDGARVFYQPRADFVGSDTFSYTLADASGMTAEGAVVVVVSSPESPHWFSDAPLRLVEGTSWLVEATLAEAVPNERRLELASSNPDVLEVPDYVTVPADAVKVAFRVFATHAGVAAVEARFGGFFAGLPVVVSPGSVTEIPVSLFESSSRVGLALANRGERMATVRLRGFSASDGSNQPGPETEVVLGPFQQVSRSLEEYDPRFAGFQGWLEASSTESGLFAMFLHFDNRLRGLAGSSSVARSTGYALPCSGLDGPDGFAFSLINNNPAAASVEVSWSDADGLRPGERRELQPLEALAASHDALGVGPAAGECQGSLIVRSSQPLAAYQQVETAELLLGQSPPGVPATARLSLPQCVAGLGWTTRLSLVNLRDAPAGIQLTFQGVGPPQTATIALTPQASETFNVADLFGWGPGQLRVGSLEILTSGGVAASATLELRNSRHVATAVPVFAETHRELIFPQAVSGRVQGVDFFTGLAVQNSGDREAVVAIDVFSEGGEALDMAGFRLAPGERVSRLLSEWLPNLGPLRGGHVRIRSTEPLAALEIFGDVSLNLLATVAPSGVARPSRP